MNKKKFIGIFSIGAIVLALIFILNNHGNKLQEDILNRWSELQHEGAREYYEVVGINDKHYQGDDAILFGPRLQAIAWELGVKAKTLRGIMYEESRLEPHIQNKATGATGLIQFMPGTAKALGTTTEELAQMNGTQQLKYVYKYLKQFPIKSDTDVFLAVFFPAAIGKDDDFVLQTPNLPAAKVAAANPTIAKGKNYITVADTKNFIKPYIS